MHLGNGAITPECVALTYGVAMAGLAASGSAVRAARPTRNQLQMAVALGCLVFAAQGINVPIAPGMSAHFVGGVLLAWVLGSGLGAWTMTAVLVTQAIALGDGGMLAVGANVLNMALVPAALVATAKRLLQVAESSPRSIALAGLVATFALPLAALLIVAETAMFRSAIETTGWAHFTAAMLTTHAMLGLVEGATTAVLLVALTPLISLRPTGRALRFALLGAASAAVIAVLVLPISSSLPDGYEAAAQASGMGWLLAP